MLYTQILLDHLKQALRKNLHSWNIDSKASISLLTISENATFLVQFGEKKYIFRFYRPFYHSNDEIISEIKFIRSLSEVKGLNVPRIFQTNKSQTLLQYSINNTLWRLTAFYYIEGREPQPSDDLKHLFYILGQQAARIHRFSQRWQLPKNFTRKTWNYETMIGEHAFWGNWRTLPLSKKQFSLLNKCALNLKKELQNWSVIKEKFGLIHGDMRLANLLVDDQKVSLIDFDDCGYSWYALEFANAISFYEDHSDVKIWQEMWLKGYQTICEINADFISKIPHLIMMRRLQLSAWLTSHSETPTARQLQKEFISKTLILAQNYKNLHC